MKNKKINFKILVLSLVVCNLSKAQSLHHQMISCQGGNSLIAGKSNMLFTIGQQSITGTTINGFSVQQGFQHSNWDKLIQQNTTSISTTTYPNPFIDVVNLHFQNLLVTM